MPLHKAIEHFTDRVKTWNKEVFEDIKQRKEWPRRRLAGVQKMLAHYASAGLLKLENKLKSWWDEVLFQEELMWYQKSRVQWL